MTKPQDLKKYITTTPDFPRPGVLFRDFTTLFHSVELFSFMIEEFVKHVKATKTTILLLPEARGFCIGSAVAHQAQIPFIVARKQGSLPPRNLDKISYKTEYSKSGFEIHKGVLHPNDRVYILDDLIALGGTAQALINFVTNAHAEVSGMGFVMNLTYLPKKFDLKLYDTKILVSYDK